MHRWQRRRRALQPLRGIALKLCAVMLFIIMLSLVKAVSAGCSCRSIGVFPLVLCDSGDRGLVALAGGIIYRLARALADGAFLARRYWHHSNGVELCGGWVFAPARSDRN